MKKSLFFVATAAVVLASCSNDVKISENTAPVGSNVQKEIVFSTYAQKAKHAPAKAPVLGSEFHATYNMEVKAYQSAPTAGAYFEKCTFAKDGEYWQGTTAQYWPLSAATINFFAVADSGMTASHITIEDALASATVAYTTTNSYSYTTQCDIMYAFGRGEVIQEGNALIFPAKVDMEFKHALALIDFQVKGAGTAETSAITINSISLKGATYTGTLTLTNTGATAASGAVTTAVSWVGNDAVNDAVAVPGINASTAITDSYARIGKGLMVIPGTGFTSFVINYSMNGNSYDYVYTPSPAVSSLTAATKYTYQINFRLHEIEIAPVVTEWTPASPVEIEVPEDSYVSFVAPTGGTYNAAASGASYTVYVTGLGSSDVVSVAAANTTLIPEVSATNNEGVAKIDFTVQTNGPAAAPRSTTITLTDTTDPTKNTTITINQAAGPGYEP